MTSEQFKHEEQQEQAQESSYSAERQPSVRQAPQSTSGLAIAGLVLGILAILGAFVPLLNIGAIPFAVVGLLLAIVGFVGIRNGKHSGRGIAIAGIVLGVVALVVILGMYGCAGAIASSSGSSSAASSSSSSAPASSAVSASKSVEMEAARTTDAPFSFLLPKGWVEEKSENGRSYYYPSATDHATMMYAGGQSTSLAAGQSESECLDVFVQDVLKSLGDFKLIEESDYSLSGFTAKRVKAQGTLESGSEPMTLQMSVAYVPGYAIAFMGASMNGMHDAEVAAVLDSLELTYDASSVDARSSESASEGSTSSKVDNGQVSPDLKEALDSYEAFMDDYIAFMERYNSSDDTASMLNDYLNYLQEYSNLMAKIEAIDADSLSTADYAYYIEVTSRVSQKLISASL